MDQSQSLNAPPYFNGSNYAFWKVRMRAFLCSIIDSVWDVVKIGWTRPEAAKSTWDKGVSLDEFHRISHVTIAKEVWKILETTYEGTKKVNDTKLQMLTTHFKELKMSEDESFDSFYGKLNEVVIEKFNLGEKTEDSKIVRKILRSLLESFRTKVTAIEESKDLDEIKVQELIGSLQTYKLSLSSQRKSKYLALKTINERLEAQDSSDEDEVEKDVAYLPKNFRKFLKFKKDGKSFEKGKFSKFKKDKKDFKKKDSRDFSPSKMVMCFECKGQGHVKKECPTYLKAKGKLFTTTLSDSDGSNSNSEESCDGEGNYSAFMAIAPVDSSEDLNLLVEELGEHTEEKSMGIGEYARMAKAAIRKMKRAKQDYKSILIRYKETKCEVEAMNGELTKAYSKIKFLELEVIQANAKVE
ncbi:uncharacterized protein LOC126721221 [Quercus robur]|uniref:uncharacterized protein LOC126721221 n=1 Tax=Quercus robur TaxID=38942 RepID=UPI0021622D80|nr:uncharacterized protein LOC126721221 [Quercus robur]